jgi:hypothetical protein
MLTIASRASDAVWLTALHRNLSVVARLWEYRMGRADSQAPPGQCVPLCKREAGHVDNGECFIGSSLLISYRCLESSQCRTRCMRGVACEQSQPHQREQGPESHWMTAVKPAAADLLGNHLADTEVRNRNRCSLQLERPIPEISRG